MPRLLHTDSHLSVLVWTYQNRWYASSMEDIKEGAGTLPSTLEKKLEPDVLARLPGHVEFLKANGYPGVSVEHPATVLAAYREFAATYTPKVPGHKEPFAPERDIHHENGAPPLIESDMALLESALS